ncbi:MAG: AAA domain-containing protein [Bacteroidota bacterium]
MQTATSKKQKLARLFYREVEKIQQQELDTADKITALYRLLNLLFVEVTRAERLQFTTLFARIAYVGHRFDLPKQLQFQIHAFRTQARSWLNRQEDQALDPSLLEQTYQQGLFVIGQSIFRLLQLDIPAFLQLATPTFAQRPSEIQSFHACIRVVALQDDPEQHQLIVRAENQPEEVQRVQYNIPDRNENFNPTIDQIRTTFRFPVSLNLIDVEIDQAGIYRPKAIVLEPDYLVDVSAISECFKDFGAAPMLYLLKKYLPFQTTKYIMIGNIANFFLDELMTHKDSTFKETFPKVFQLNPLAFAIFDNRLVREIMQTSQKHFLHLKRVIQQDFPASDIEPSDCYLEPSFYSEKYGLQGRLDVFYKQADSSKQSAIVELKSGKPFKANTYGISSNHFTQTLLYDLIIKSVFEKGIAPANFILYSGVEDRQLRFAPSIKAQQYEAIQIRNQIVAIERGIANLLDQPLDSPNFFSLLSPTKLTAAKGFIEKDLGLFEKVYRGMRSIDRHYFTAFSGFIAHEQWLAKTGVQGLENVNGLASLWLNDLEEKEASFDIISHLRILEDRAKDNDPIIVFQKTERTNPLANFRNGDIAVLYPYRKAGDNVLTNQIFKCTIIQIDEQQLSIRLRSRQFNNLIFQSDVLWNLEHDMMDSSFTEMYRNLFRFVQYDSHKKDLLLGIAPPTQSAPAKLNAPGDLTTEQQGILQRMISAKDYFLLWGPPGTGKTSMMLKHFVSYILNHTDENLLLLAYTNRAVDEICQAIESIDKYARQEYLRIGSRYATAPPFRDRLFSTQLEKINTRQGLKELIDKHRIFVSTVASISNKQELLQLKTFQRVVIDEASQILEPLLVGLLPRFEQFILIGDHQQLPAVVVQDKERSASTSPELKKIGLQNMRDSLFERLYKRCKAQDWDWAYAQLSHQGRMHQVIMDFPNEYFYKGRLHILPEGIAWRLQQMSALSYELPAEANDLEERLARRRMMFFDTAPDEASSSKTNRHEAIMLSQIVGAFQRIYAANGMEFHHGTLGVITPYRAQIACIRQHLEASSTSAKNITIDTVERYQGGARDIIILSLCTNTSAQLHSLVSLSNEGVDRKLNVALTRARQHLIVLGNKAILSQNEVYQKLVNYCGEGNML